MKGIDTLKVFFSLIVVWIHTGVGNLGGLTTAAVPFFFTVSGFLLFGKLFNETNLEDRSLVIKKWWYKTLRLYLIWSLIFFPFAVIGLYHDNLSFFKSTALYLYNLLFIGENYLSWPLWYLLGLLWAGAIIWISNKLRLPFWVFCLIALVLFAMPRVFHFHEFYYKFFKTTRNGLFIGFPFMVLGGFIRKVLPSGSYWERGCIQEKTALYLRFLSIHIYLTHMLWAGTMTLVWGPERGFSLWAITSAISIVTGLLIRPCGRLVKFLYGRAYRA